MSPQTIHFPLEHNNIVAIHTGPPSTLPTYMCNCGDIFNKPKALRDHCYYYTTRKVQAIVESAGETVSTGYTSTDSTRDSSTAATTEGQFGIYSSILYLNPNINFPFFILIRRFSLLCQI